MPRTEFMFNHLQISEYISDAIIAINKDDLKIKYLNNKAEDFFRKSKVNVINKKINYFLDDTSLLLDYIKNALIKQGSYLYNNVSVKIKNFPVSKYFYQVEVINNIELNFIILTLKLDNEIIKIKEEKNEIFNKIDEVVTKIIESLKNPISSIKGSIQLISKKNKVDEELKDIILIECQKIFKLINIFESKLLNNFDKKEKKNIHEIIRKSLNKNNFFFKKKVKIIESFDPSLPSILVEKNNISEAFSQIFFDSLSCINSEKGYLKITTKFMHGSSVKIPNIKNLSKNNYINIQLEDNRTLSEKFELDNIFFPFFKDKNNNQRLGLYIAKKIINNHHGTIDVFKNDILTKIVINLPIL